MQIRERHLTTNPEATLLIKKYFVASRRARINETQKGSEMPMRALQTMYAPITKSIALFFCENNEYS